MKQVSEAYKQSMSSEIRERSYVRVIFDNFDTTIPSDGEWASNGESGLSDFSTVDFERVYTEKYATFEHNRWALDGSFDIAPDDGAATGFVSSMISNEYGDTVSPVILTRSFTKPHTIPGLTLIFDTRTHERPDSVTVNFYLGSEMVKHETIHVDGDYVSVITDVEACDKIIIAFGLMPPYRFPRLEAVGYGVQKEFVNEDIVSTRNEHDVDPLSRRAPKESFQFTIMDYDRKYDPDNPTGVWKYVAEKANVSIQYGYDVNGNIEWVKPDRYVLDSRPSFSENKATFNATGMTARMSEKYYKGTIGEKTFYDLAEAVLRDAGLPPLPDGRDPWVIHDSLKGMKTTAAMPIATHANCLQMIAHACCCLLRTDDDNVIHIEPFTIGEPTDFIVDFSTISQNSQTMSKIDQLKSVVVRRYSHLLSIPSELFSETVDDTTMHVEFDSAAKGVTVDIEGETVNINELNIEDSFNVANDPYFFEWSENQLTNNNRNMPNTTARTVITANADMTLSFNYEFSARDESEFALTVAGTSVAGESGKFSGSIKAGDTVEIVISNGAAGDGILSISGLICKYDVTGTYEIYARAVDLEMSPGIKKVTITGMRVRENISSYYLEVSNTGSVDEENNPLITDIKMCKALARHVAAYLQKRNTYSVSYRGNPELECGDIIGLQTMYTDRVGGLVLTDEITFNGSLKGKMKVKML